ncbi:tyrosine-protein phosphatase [Leucobacter luti]|uniref:Protein-tyrosine phosphatase n=1 Tax=Leucobacter luti TaxID=340320 RepID=A0A4Q7TVB6_9MICO|nr:tyrosine-protein phosphatase [Leucobacter luti]MBL3698052.1 tyrosine-protein phosphatase [Leucobacter luti]RZT64864.1 protein-tyrosine phosphatase [Leucobacter luti]
MTVPDRRVPLTSVFNMRDLGGLPVAGGTVVPGQVYRSASLAELSDADGAAFVDREITTVYDLRTAGERAGAPDRVPPAVASIPLDVLADSPVAAAANINGMLANPGVLADALGGGKAETMLQSSYRDIVALPSALASYRAFFRGIGDDARAGAALFHCTTGKDRTGWGAAALLALLGASDEVIRADYLQTNTDLLPSLQPVMDQAAAAGIDPELIRPVLGVEESYLDAAYQEVADRFGTIEDYFSAGLGLEAADIDALRARLIA